MAGEIIECEIDDAECLFEVVGRSWSCRDSGGTFLNLYVQERNESARNYVQELLKQCGESRRDAN